jgi:hypothetical protein
MSGDMPLSLLDHLDNVGYLNHCPVLFLSVNLHFKYTTSVQHKIYMFQTNHTDDLTVQHKVFYVKNTKTHILYTKGPYMEDCYQYQINLVQLASEKKNEM